METFLKNKFNGIKSTTFTSLYKICNTLRSYLINSNENLSLTELHKSIRLRSNKIAFTHAYRENIQNITDIFKRYIEAYIIGKKSYEIGVSYIEIDKIKAEKYFNVSQSKFEYLYSSFPELEFLDYLANIELFYGSEHYSKQNYAEAKVYLLRAEVMFKMLLDRTQIEEHKNPLHPGVATGYAISVAVGSLYDAYLGNNLAANERMSRLVSENIGEIDFLYINNTLLKLAEHLFMTGYITKWLISCVEQTKDKNINDCKPSKKKIVFSLLQHFTKILVSLRSSSTNNAVMDEIKKNLVKINNTIDTALNYQSNNISEVMLIRYEIQGKLSQFLNLINDIKSFEHFSEYAYREELKYWIISQVQCLSVRVIKSIECYVHRNLFGKSTTNEDNDKCRMCMLSSLCRFQINFKFQLPTYYKSTKSLNRNQVENSFEHGMASNIFGICEKDPEIAEKYFIEALNIFKNLEEPSIELFIKIAMAITEFILGSLLFESSKFMESRDHLLQSRDVFSQVINIQKFNNNPDVNEYLYHDFECDYDSVHVLIAYCEVNLGNAKQSNEIISTLIASKRDKINFSSNMMIFNYLVRLEELIIKKGITVDWMDKCIKLIAYNFDYDWKDPHCRIAAQYIKYGNPLKGIKLLLDYNNEFEKRYRYPYNLNAVYGICCALIDITEKGIDIFNEIPEYNALWLSNALSYFEIINCLNYFDKFKTKSGLCIDVTSLPLPLSEKTMIDQQFYEIYSVENRQHWRGICVIINNISFLDEKEWRNGTIIDALWLINIFIKFKYWVTVLNDESNDEIMSTLKEIASCEELKDNNSFICIALSHGDNGVINGVHSRVYTREIIDIFSDKNCPNLANKPKIFIFNSCRGTKIYECDLNLAENCISQNFKKIQTNLLFNAQFDWHNMFIWYSTIEGFVSYRNGSKGALFINKLITVLMQYASNNTLMDLAKRVEFLLRTELCGKSYKQVTSIETFGWCKEFYFIRNNTQV